MNSFSGGFSWANFDLGVIALPRRNLSSTQRASAKRSRVTSTTTDNLGSSDGKLVDKCDVSLMTPPTEIVLTCLCILVAVSISRSALVLFYVYCVHKEAPAALLFPAWEGPGGLCLHVSLLVSAQSVGFYLCAECMHITLSATISEGTITHTHQSSRSFPGPVFGVVQLGNRISIPTLSSWHRSGCHLLNHVPYGIFGVRSHTFKMACEEGRVGVRGKFKAKFF